MGVEDGGGGGGVNTASVLCEVLKIRHRTLTTPSDTDAGHNFAAVDASRCPAAVYMN